MKHMIAVLTLGFVIGVHASQSTLLCGNNEQARKLATMIIQSPKQQRDRMICDPLLSQLAQEKAEEMARFSMVSHTISVGANQRLREGGFSLPRYYPMFWGNNVEAIQGGAPDATHVFQAFMESKGHRTHLMGEHSFYRSQTHIGIAHVRSPHSAHLDYWVVYIAHHKDLQPEFQQRLMAKK